MPSPLTHTTSPAVRRSKHVAVLLQETIGLLSPKENAVILDGTLGGGGHAEALIPLLGESGRYIGIDADEEALARTEVFLRTLFPKAHLDFVCENARYLDKVLASCGVKAVDAVLFDLGISSDQLTPEGEGRGFGFDRDEPLAMTLSAHPSGETLTAEYIVNEWAEETLADILFGFGEEHRARRIARAIGEARAKERIHTSRQLSEIVVQCVGRSGKIHPATKTFQALRIATNDELGALAEMLEKAMRALAPEGRLAVITFHSLEDRVVKHTFLRYMREEGATLLTKHPIVPLPEEIARNRRARSAKLRGVAKSAPLLE